MFITFRSIGRSTTLNIPVYEYGVSFKLLVSSFFQKYSMVFSAQNFHFLGGFCAALLGSSRDRDGNDGLVKTVNIPSLPSEPTLWLLVLQELWAMPFTTAYKWAPYWEFSLNLSVHLTIGMFTSTLPMPGPRYTYIRLISSGHQIVYNREKPEEAISCLFLFVGARRAELSSVVATNQISLSILTYIFKQ